MWALRSDEVVLTLSLFKRRYVEAPDGDGPVMIAATVRTNDPQPPQQPPTLYLNTLPGDQFSAALRPAPTARPGHLDIPARPLGSPARWRSRSARRAFWWELHCAMTAAQTRRCSATIWSCCR